MSFAHAHITVVIDNRTQHSRPTGYNLASLVGRLYLSPLKHGLDYAAVTTVFSRSPQTLDILIQRLILDQLRTLKRGVLSISPDQREIVMRHIRAALKQIGRKTTNLVHIICGSRRDRVNLKAWVFDLQFLEGIVGLHRLLEGILCYPKAIVEFRHPVK